MLSLNKNIMEYEMKIVEGKVVEREALAISDERVLPEKLKAIEQLIKAWTAANSRQ